MRRSQGSRMPLALGGNLIWSKLAPCLVGLENLRTESAYSEKLSALLAGVKLFVANYPFFAHSFLVNLLQRPWGPWGPWGWISVGPGSAGTAWRRWCRAAGRAST